MSRFLHRCALAQLLALALAVVGWPAWAQSGDGAQPPAATRKAAPPKHKAPAKHKPAPARPKAAAPAAAPAPTPAVSNVVHQADYIVAIVNTEPITNNEVRARMARAERDLKQAGTPPPPEAELRKEVLDRLITERAEVQYARGHGMTVSDEALKQAELSIARQNQLTSIDELKQQIEAEGITFNDFVADLKNQVLLAELRAREIEPDVKVTNAEVDAFVQEQSGGHTTPSEINLAMILVAVPEGTSPQEVERLKAKADDIAKRARAGEDFAKLASEYSDANKHGTDGGVLGMRPVNEYPDLFLQATKDTPVGGIAGPVKSGAGFHILKVLDRQQGGQVADVKIPLTHVRQILLKVGPQQGQQVAIDRLADFKRRIQSGEARFSQLAQQYSQDASAKDGGDLGWVPPGQFVPEFEQAMNNLDVGQISDPIVTRFGVQLIQVEGRREQVLTAAQQHDLARNILREKKTQEAFADWARDVRARAYVEYRDPPQ
jgi:peptidyl-prolyl cis-trans isomerase SurA